MFPLLTGILTPVAVLLAGMVAPAEAAVPTTMLVTGLFQALVFATALVGWAQYVDRRPLSNYGLSTSPAWLLDLVVAVGAVLVGHGIWYAAGTSLGWSDVTLVAAAPEGSLAVGLVAGFVAIAVNVWVQEMAFVAIPVRNAAEGLASRGVTPRRAVLAGWLVATLLFAVAHGRSGLAAWVNLLVALGVYALLYVHTGEMAFPVGVHLGVNFSASFLFAPAGGGLTVFRVAESLPGLLGSMSGGRIPQILVAYLLLIGWLQWRHDEVTIRTELTQWTERDRGLSEIARSRPDS